jgi:hypothetical protein
LGEKDFKEWERLIGILDGYRLNEGKDHFYLGTRKVRELFHKINVHEIDI